MTAIADIRTAGEADLARRLRKLNKKHQKVIRGALSRYGSLTAIPETVWEKIQDEIDSQTTAALLLIYIAAHDSTTTTLGVQVPTAAADRQAREFAAQRSQDFAGAYVKNTRERLQKALEAARATPVTPPVIPPVGDVTRGIGDPDKTTLSDTDIIKPDTIADILNDKRSDAAGVTETTTGISGGQRGGADDFERDDPLNTVKMIWRTERDARVCPICSPLDGKGDKVWNAAFPSGSPAHISCRCQLVAVGNKGRLTQLTDKLTRGVA